MYSVTVVGNNAVSSAEEVMCLDEWLLGGGTDGIEVNIGGSTSKVRHLAIRMHAYTN